MPDESLLAKIAAALESYDWPALTSLYRPDAVYDANVPHWRFQLLGPAAVQEHAREELDGITDLRVAESAVTRTEDGLVVELELRYRDELWREVNIIHTDGGQITEHRVYCTGAWDAATISRQAVEAPMVRG